ncbi:hypothetical protein TNCV_2817191 [Trichonephila clavipes]|nr:hypothetical protein TNCV_2817191 [Trichonephila clavipes]
MVSCGTIGEWGCLKKECETFLHKELRMLKMGAAFAECRSEANAQTIFGMMFGPIQLGYTANFLQQFVTMNETWIHHHSLLDAKVREKRPGLKKEKNPLSRGQRASTQGCVDEGKLRDIWFSFLERMSDQEQAGGRDGRRPSPSRNRRRNDTQSQRSALTVSMNRGRIPVPQNRAVNLDLDNVMSRAAGDRNIVNPSRQLARPAFPPPIARAARPVNLPAPVRPAGAARPVNLPAPVRPAGAARPVNLPAPVRPAGAARPVNLPAPVRPAGAARPVNLPAPVRPAGAPRPVNLPAPVRPAGAARPVNLPAPVRPAGAAHPYNLQPPIRPAGDMVQEHFIPVQAPPAQHARYLCIVCRRFFNVIAPHGPRVCPNCRQNEDEDLNPMAEREQRRQQLYHRFFR